MYVHTNVAKKKHKKFLRTWFLRAELSGCQTKPKEPCVAIVVFYKLKRTRAGIFPVVERDT
jgi:hypothetical protein